MKPIAEYQRITDRLFTWQDYNPEVKCDCSCVAALTPEGFLVVDPLPLENEPAQELFGEHGIAAIVITSANHQRESLAMAARYQAKIYAHPGARPEVQADVWLKEGDILLQFFQVIELEGFAQGEIALFGMNSLIFGDAVINIGPHGLELLPDKYCENPRLARKSAQKLLALQFGVLCMAHGTPVVSQAMERLQALVASL